MHQLYGRQFGAFLSTSEVAVVVTEESMTEESAVPEAAAVPQESAIPEAAVKAKGKTLLFALTRLTPVCVLLSSCQHV